MNEIREIVAMFMENDDDFTELEGNDWYDMEDKLVGFIEHNMCKLHTAIEHEYAMEDVANMLADNDMEYDEELVEKIVDEYERLRMKYGGEEDNGYLVEAFEKFVERR